MKKILLIIGIVVLSVNSNSELIKFSELPQYTGILGGQLYPYVLIDKDSNTITTDFELYDTQTIISIGNGVYQLRELK